MTKKILVAMVLAAALIVIGQVSKVEAAEVYVGSYSDGTSVYLLTETISSRHGERHMEYSCRVRAGRDYLTYNFSGPTNNPYYWNSEGYRGYCFDGSSPVAAAIYRYIRNNY